MRLAFSPVATIEQLEQSQLQQDTHSTDADPSRKRSISSACSMASCSKTQYISSTTRNPGGTPTMPRSQRRSGRYAKLRIDLETVLASNNRSADTSSYSYTSSNDSSPGSSSVENSPKTPRRFQARRSQSLHDKLYQCASQSPKGNQSGGCSPHLYHRDEAVVSSFKFVSLRRPKSVEYKSERKPPSNLSQSGGISEATGYCHARPRRRRSATVNHPCNEDNSPGRYRSRSECNSDSSSTFTSPRLSSMTWDSSGTDEESDQGGHELKGEEDPCLVPSTSPSEDERYSLENGRSSGEAAESYLRYRCKSRASMEILTKLKHLQELQRNDSTLVPSLISAEFESILFWILTASDATLSDMLALILFHEKLVNGMCEFVAMVTNITEGNPYVKEKNLSDLVMLLGAMHEDIYMDAAVALKKVVVHDAQPTKTDLVAPLSPFLQSIENMAILPGLSMVSPRRFVITDHDPKQIAQAICAVDACIMRSIPPRDFLRWGKNSTAVAMKRTSARFNQVSFAVATAIVRSGPAKKKLWKTCSFFLKVAKHLLHLRDFQGFASVLAGFSHVSVLRLKKVIKESNLHLKIKKFKRMLSPNGNYVRYRSLIKSNQAPYLPFLPPTLRDLTFLHEKNTVDYDERLEITTINYTKIFNYANVVLTNLNAIARFSHLYNQTVPTSLIQSVISLEHLSDNQLYHRSREIFPNPYEKSSTSLLENLVEHKVQNPLWKLHHR